MADATIVLQVQNAGMGGSGGVPSPGTSGLGSSPTPGSTSPPQPGMSQEDAGDGSGMNTALMAGLGSFRGTQALVGMGMALPVAGGIAAGLAIAALAAIAFKEAIEEATEQMDILTSSLSDLSGPVAAAQARAEVREIQMLMRRDQAVGGFTAEYVDLTSRINTSLEDIRTNIMTVIAPKFLPLVRFVETVVSVLQTISTQLMEMDRGMQAMMDAALSSLEAAFRGMGFGGIAGAIAAIRSLFSGSPSNTGPNYWNNILFMFESLVEQHFPGGRAPQGWSFNP